MLIAQDNGDSGDLWEERWLRFVSLCHLPTDTVHTRKRLLWLGNQQMATTADRRGQLSLAYLSLLHKVHLLFTRSGCTGSGRVWSGLGTTPSPPSPPSPLANCPGENPLMRAQRLELRGWRQDGPEEYCHDACSCIDLYMTVGRETLPRRSIVNSRRDIVKRRHGSWQYLNLLS